MRTWILNAVVLLGIALAPVMAQNQSGSAQDTVVRLIPVGSTVTNVIVDKVEKQLFHANELQLEIAGQARTEDFDAYARSMDFGLNFFPYRTAGLHAAVGLKDFNEQFIDRVEFGLVGRMPVEFLKSLGGAIAFGIGAEYQRVVEGATGADLYKGLNCGGGTVKEGSATSGGDRDDQWAVYAEIGPVFRFRYFDVFGKIRGVRPTKSADGEHIALIAGVNIVLF